MNPANVRPSTKSVPCVPPWAFASFESGGAVEEWELLGALLVLADPVAWELTEWLLAAEVTGELDGKVAPVGLMPT